MLNSQLTNDKLKVQDMTKVASGLAAESKYTGVGQAFVKIWKEEGFVGYFKGNGTNVIRIIPINAIQFLSYEKYKNVNIFTIESLTFCF